MANETEKVFVAMSGGVDSSVAAALLLEAGYSCSAGYMITADHLLDAKKNAEEVAKKLGIKLYVLDLRNEFEQVLEYFCGEYRQGRTPNPCVFCNRHIKFGKLLSFAMDNGEQYFATGHYAKIIRDGTNTGLYETTNVTKDQSYVLSMIDRNVLQHIILPIGDYTKDQTRKLAVKFNLGTEKTVESQEICFIPNDDWVAVLEQRCPELVRSGDIVDSSGKVLGKHNGVHRFTIGQRRGLRVAMGMPYYVMKIDAADNTVTLGPKEEFMHSSLVTRGVNWLIDTPVSAFRAKVKIRYNDKGSSATVIPHADDVVVEFDGKVSAITPGQLAVFYVQEGERNRVAGGGWIEKTID